MADIVAKLRDLFEREHDALVAGDLNGLDELAQSKSQLISNLGALRDVDAVQQLQQLATRNARLLEAARRGVVAARTRIQQIKSGGSELKTYDRSGQMQTLTSGAHQVERKA